jgi:phosphoglycerol transferase
MKNINFNYLLIFFLSLFYLWIVFLIVNPNVSEEYRAYYIERITSDWRPLRYTAVVSEGFDFSKPGLPSFIRYTAGISYHESWGRWTDASLKKTVRIIYEEPFFGDVCVNIMLSPALPQIGRLVVIRFGSNEQQFVTQAGAQWYQLDFRLDDPTSTLEIEPSVSATPALWDPTNKDPREISLGLYRLIALPGACKELESSNL